MVMTTSAVAQDAYFDVVAGALVRSGFRAELESLKFKGERIEWIESKGWIESKFTLKGDPALLKAIAAKLQEWNEEKGR